MQGQCLVRCKDMWCPWQDEGTVSVCPHRGGTEFKYPYCKLYSTPGPHSPSRISKVLGESLVKVNAALERAHTKMAREREFLVEVEDKPFAEGDDE